ncbi:MAG TPA: hypothetical protein VGH44_01975 [Candidatus Saccharimonadia bacterium]|jgi:hypothetical protein
MSSDFPTPEELRAMKPPSPPPPVAYQSQPPRSRSFGERRADRAAAKARAEGYLQEEQDRRREWARQEADGHGRYILESGPKGYYDHWVNPIEVRAPGYHGGSVYDHGEFISATTSAVYLAEEYRARGLNARIVPAEDDVEPPAGSDHSGGKIVFPGGDPVIVRVSW